MEGSVCKHKIPSARRYFELLGSYFYELAVQSGFSPEVSSDLRLALEEALMNVRKHAYNESDHHPIQVEFEKKAGSIEVRIRDYGNRFSPGEIVPVDLKWLRENGIAVHYITEVMDRVNYVTIFKRGAMLVMEKNLP